MTIRRRSLAQTVVGSALVLGMTVAVTPPGASATESVRPFAGKGTVTGQITPAPAGARFEPVVRASRLDVAGPAASTVANAAGRYRLRLPVGLWAVTAPSWTSGQLAYVTKVVPVGAGKSTVLRSRPAETLAAAPIRLTSGPWQAAGAFPDDLNAQVVSSAYQNLAAVDLFSALDSACSASRPEAVVVEFRGPGGRFADIMREVKLGLSKYANAEFRAMAKKALRSLKANAPTHTVTGDVTFTDVGGQVIQTVTARVTEDKTGLVTWQKEYSGPADADFYFTATEEVGRDLAKDLCRKDTGAYPKVMHVVATATVTGSDDSVSGSVKATAEWDVKARAGEPTNYEATAPVVWTIMSSNVTSKGTCGVSGTGVDQPGAGVASSGAAIDDAKRVRLVVASVFQVGWRETQPPSSCNDSGVLGLVLSASALTVPLGGTGTSSGTSIPGTTFTITAEVTAK